MPDSKLNAPAPLDASWSEMPEAELQKQDGRQPPADPPDESPTLSLADARQRLASKTQGLLSATPRELPNLIVDIQKLRVLCMLLSEAEEGGKSDPNTYREMSMLNRMLAIAGPGEDDPGLGDDLVAEEQAADRLLKRGISRESVPQMVRILSALSGRTPPPQPEADDEGDEPDMADLPPKATH